jgi:hypothetical protein
LDVENNTLYWIDTRHTALVKTPLGNTEQNSRTLVDDSIVVPSSQLLFDAKRSEIIWADDGAAVVKRVSLEGEDLIPYSIDITGK